MPPLPPLNSSSRLNLELFNKAYSTQRYRLMRNLLTRAMSIRMVNGKELESEYSQVILKIMYNGVLMIYTE